MKKVNKSTKSFMSVFIQYKVHQITLFLPWIFILECYVNHLMAFYFRSWKVATDKNVFFKIKLILTASNDPCKSNEASLRKTFNFLWIFSSWRLSRKILSVYHQFRQDVNFINILQAAFSTILLHRNNTNSNNSISKVIL